MRLHCVDPASQRINQNVKRGEKTKHITLCSHCQEKQKIDKNKKEKEKNTNGRRRFRSIKPS